MKLSLAYFTNRIEPKFEWFIDSLMHQFTDDIELDLMFIDLQLDYNKESRLDQLAKAMRGRLEYRHLPVKPCSWQGTHRKTKSDFFSASNTRNTAIIQAKHEHLACMDDLSVLMPGWIDQVRHAVEHNYVMCGAYKKADELKVNNGIIESYGKEYVDSRWSFGQNGIKQCTGDLLYGCSFVVPIDYALRVNGFDEYCDGGGAEDYDFGIRLQRVGAKIYYNRNALTIESNELHSQPPMMIRRKKICLNGEESDYFMLNQLSRQPNRYTTLGDWTNLSQCRIDGSYDSVNLPTHDWCDNQPLSEMGDDSGNNTPKYPV